MGREDPLEQELATHSRILAWRVPWTEEPGRLQSMGLQRVGLDWAGMCTHTHTQFLKGVNKHSFWTLPLLWIITTIKIQVLHAWDEPGTAKNFPCHVQSSNSPVGETLRLLPPDCTTDLDPRVIWASRELYGAPGPSTMIPTQQISSYSTKA